MSKTNELETFVQDIIEPEGYELTDLEYRKESGRWILRIFADKPGGIMLDDCQVISNKISFLIDAENRIPGAYNIEVSSPGLNRRLKKRKDFERFLNSKVSVKTFDEIENQRNFTGNLVSADEEKITVEDVTSGIKEIPYKAIAIARLCEET